MADKEIVNLSSVSNVVNDILIPCYVPGSADPAQKVSVAQLKAAIGVGYITVSSVDDLPTDAEDGTVAIVGG